MTVDFIYADRVVSLQGATVKLLSDNRISIQTNGWSTVIYAQSKARTLANFDFINSLCENSFTVIEKRLLYLVLRSHIWMGSGSPDELPLSLPSSSGTVSTITNADTNMDANQEEKKETTDTEIGIDRERNRTHDTMKPMYHRFKSFAPIRNNSRVTYLVNAGEYFPKLVSSLLEAKHRVFIAGWCFSPKLYLLRENPLKKEHRIEEVLLHIANKVPLPSSINSLTCLIMI